MTMRCRSGRPPGPCRSPDGLNALRPRGSVPQATLARQVAGYELESASTNAGQESRQVACSCDVTQLGPARVPPRPSSTPCHLFRDRSIRLPRAPGDLAVPEAGGMNRLPTSMRYRRRHDRYQQYEKPLPGHQLQIGVKFLEPLPGRRRYYQHTAIDDCTRIRISRSTSATPSRLRSPSSTTSCPSFPSPSSASRPTKAVSSGLSSTGTCSTRTSSIATFGPGPHLHGRRVQSAAAGVGAVLQLPPAPGSLDGQTLYERMRDRLGLERHG